MSSENRLDSFVLRFIHEEGAEAAADTPPVWRGVIRHVQSNSERHVTQWDEIVAFIEQYVSLLQQAGDAADDGAPPL